MYCAEVEEPVPTTEPQRLQLAMFVDAYAAWQTGDAGTLATLSNHRLFSGQGANLRAENGFSLAFLGFDARYDAGNLGAVAALRFGEGAAIYHFKSEGGTDLDFGVDHIDEAYAFWKPQESIELDAGLFLSPFGVEQLESWRNPTYTRGAVGNYAQPNWHTGLRAQWQLAEQLSLVGFIANGTNIASETQEDAGLDQNPTAGIQLGYAPNELLSLALGGLIALDQEDNGDGGFDVFGDFVGTLQHGALTASVNTDLVVTRDGAPDGGERYCWGAAVSAGYRFTELLGVGARGEYLRDDANYGGGDVWQLLTGTLTLDLRLTPLATERHSEAPLLVLRWENRWEKSNQDVFGKESRGTSDVADDLYTDTWFESVVGIVFTTEP